MAPIALLVTFLAVPGTAAAVTPTISFGIDPVVQIAGRDTCVTGTLVDGDSGDPIAGAPVGFDDPASSDLPPIVATNTNGVAQHCYTRLTPGFTGWVVFYDTNGSGNPDPGEPSAGNGIGSNHVGVTLTFNIDPVVQIVGRDTCVSTNVIDPRGDPITGLPIGLAGASVGFDDVASNDQPPVVTTDTNGNAQHCYTRVTPGHTGWVVFYDTNNNGNRDTDEPTTNPGGLGGSHVGVTLGFDIDPVVQIVGRQTCMSTTTLENGSLAPVAGAPVGFDDLASSDPAPIRTTDSTGSARYCYTRLTPGFTGWVVFYDTNDNGARDTGEPTSDAHGLGGSHVFPELSATVDPAVQIAGHATCVIATLTDARDGTGLATAPVGFQDVYTGPPATIVTTDANGIARHCYTRSTPGFTTLEVFSDTAANGTFDIEDPRERVTGEHVAGDEPPRCDTVGADRTSIWPPNHKFVTVTISGGTDPESGPVTLTVTGVTQDELLNGPDDGNTTPDARSAARPDAVELRAERSGSGDGRVYRIGFRVTDPGGQSCAGTIAVSVPHSANGSAVDSGLVVNSFGP